MKKIEIKNENIVMNLLKKGFKVEGRLWLEETEDGEFIIWFDRYNRKPQPKQCRSVLRSTRASPRRLAHLAFWR